MPVSKLRKKIDSNSLTVRENYSKSDLLKKRVRCAFLWVHNTCAPVQNVT